LSIRDQSCVQNVGQKVSKYGKLSLNLERQNQHVLILYKHDDK